ncbi:condensin-2 complex subunit G2 [Tachysurus fulvidraco]|uniref:condensin-2 complex subunit G2 n=1 Tax=Tachysurus fulvidraco TaxID=1234273 RepID=UPI001FEF64C4|nr:condensin-2 complex subunit G2 [Tachysurus fulvidraco]
MSKRKNFMESVHPDRVQDFLHFINLHKDVSEPLDLSELIQELEMKQRLELWGKMSALLKHTLHSYPSERWISRLENDSDGDDMEVEQSAELKHTMAVLEGVTLVCTVCVDSVQSGDNYTDLLDCLYSLNSVESCLPLSEVPLQKAIHWLFECWWRRGLQGKEELGWTAFVACLENTIMLKKTLTELNRLYSLRDILLSVEFDSERGQYITNPLLQCFLNTNHIKREEGKRFLAFLFSWDVGFIKMIHETIKNQLQFLSKAVAEDVAEIYFRAWKKASSPFLEEIELSCIQDLMQHGVLLHRSSPVQSKVRQILSYLHKQKFRQGVDEMLHRLYMPILWKALKSVNAEVRANATLLFTEAFPIQDPNMSSDRVDELVQKQLDTLFALLEDMNPSVRCAAVLGACSVLSRCWELLPSSIITDLLKKLLELATDSSSPDCRCAVFMCLSMILDNRMSHPLMEELLPALKLSLHDTSEKVRVAFVDLLLKIKAVRAAKFWKVCSMEHLLKRLELDSVCVSKRIVNLLFTSFFPLTQPEAVWCERCVSMIQMNHGAARKFYRYAYMYTAPTNIVKLMLMIRKCLNACIQKTAESPDESVCSNKENSVLEDVLSVKDTTVMASLLELVVILWKSVQKSLQLNQEALQYTTVKFASVLPEYLRVFQDERCTAALIRLASLLPVSAVPAFRSKVSAQLKRLDSGSPVSLYSQLIECVCGWGQLSHVLELAVLWLTEATPLKTVDESGRGSRQVQFDEPEVEMKPELGLDYLEYVLSRPHIRDSLLSLSVDQLTPLITALAAWKEVLYSSLTEGEVNEAVTETALRAFGIHSRLTVHLQYKDPQGRTFLTTLEESVDWVEKRVLPFLVAPGDSVCEQQLSLGRRIVEICLYVCKDAVLLALGDSDFNEQVLQLCSYVLLSEKGYMCVPVLLSLLTEVAQDCVSHDAEGQEEQLSVSLRIIANIFQKILEVMAHRLRKDKEEGQELCCSSVDALSNFLLVTQVVSEKSEVMTGIFSSLCAAIIIDVSRTLQKISDPEHVKTPETATDLPPLSSSIMSAILRSPTVTRCFLSEMSSTVDSEAIDSIGGLAAITHVLAIVRKTEKFSALLKGIGVSVHRQILQHYGVTADESAHRFIYENAVGTLNELLMP